MANSQISWRPESTNCYESIWSVIRKYAYLNRIPKSFSKSDLLGIKNSYAKISGEVSIRYDTRLLSRLLGGEGEANTAWLDPYVFGQEIIQHFNCSRSANLRYCDECIRRGYHSPIHQLPWIIYCPIHLSILKDRCPQCHSHINLESWIDPCSGPKRSSGINYGCHCGYELWTDFKSGNWPSGLRKEEARPIGTYLRWIKSLSATAEANHAIHAMNFIRAKKIDFELLNELVSFWISLCPPPPSIARVLGNFPDVRMTSFDFRFAQPEADAFIELLESVDYRGLCEGFIGSHVRLNVRLPHQYCARRLLKSSTFRHQSCVHQKKILERKYVFKLSSYGGYHQKFNYICPQSTLIAMLTNVWVALWQDGSPINFLEDYLNYSNGAYSWITQEMAASGLMVASKHSEEEGRIALSWHPALYRFVSHLTVALWEATASALCERYLRYGFDDHREKWLSGNLDIYPKRPYVIVYKVGRDAVRMVIFKRSKSIHPSDLSRLKWDEHDPDIDRCLQSLIDGYAQLRHELSCGKARPNSRG